MAELVGKDGLGRASGLALLPDGVEFERGVLRDGLLDLSHVGQVKVGELVVRRGHLLQEFFVVERQASEDLEA